MDQQTQLENLGLYESLDIPAGEVKSLRARMGFARLLVRRYCRKNYGKSTWWLHFNVQKSPTGVKIIRTAE